MHTVGTAGKWFWLKITTKTPGKNTFLQAKDSGSFVFVDPGHSEEEMESLVTALATLGESINKLHLQREECYIFFSFGIYSMR